MSQEADVRPVVLIVEDEPMIAISLERMLKEAGYEVVGTAPSVAKAMHLMPHVDFDGALLDINLRGEKVYPVADHLLALNIPYVFVTGHSANAVPPAHRGARVVTKPYLESELLETIRATVDQARRSNPGDRRSDL